MIRLTVKEKEVLASALKDYSTVWQYHTECTTPARAIAAHVLSESSLTGNKYYAKEDKLTDYINELLGQKEELN